MPMEKLSGSKVMPSANTPTRTHIDLYGAVLAGGLSSRMGCDKRFLSIEGESLVDRAVRIMTVAVGGVSEKVFLCGDVPNRESLADEVSGLGPLGGVLSAMRQVCLRTTSKSPQEQWLLIIPVDMPLLSVEILEKLAQLISCSSRQAISFEDFEMPFAIRCSLENQKSLKEICGMSLKSARSIRAFQKILEIQCFPLENRLSELMLNTNGPNEWAKVVTARG